MEKSNQKRIVNLLGYDGLKIITRNDILNFSLDSTILAYYVTIHQKANKIMDLGCGSGFIPIFLTLRTKKDIYGVEIQKDLCDIACESVKINKLEDQIKIINEDIKNLNKLFNPSSFDVIVSNPPYFTSESSPLLKLSEFEKLARHEILINLDELLKAASYLLKEGGTFAMVHRSERLLEIMNTFRKYHIEPKTIKFVYDNKKSKESNVIFIEGKKSIKIGGLKVLQPLYVKNDDGTYTKEILDIFNFMKE